MIDLSDISIWKKSFGLLPIHLKPTNNESNFVMLNGGYGDFCLQTKKDESDVKDYFSKSWSSNTKNFVVLDKDNVRIYNWLKNKPEEVISQKQVSDNFDKFYNYLLSKSIKSEKDVVPVIIDIFRQFRNITLEKTNPVEALNLLFVLLTSLEDDYNNIDITKWNINSVHIPNGFDNFTEKLQIGIDNIKPELDLIIRHSAGVLFQEAQKEVLFFNPQRDLFGGVSNKIQTLNNLYSSIHYTPPYLARTIVENALRIINLKKPNLKIFDPACGSSEFLIETLKQLKELNYSGNIIIKGWDTSETAINTSNFLLKYEQRTIWKERLSFEIKLVDDSLTEFWNADYDLILMNPPFVSWEQLNTKNLRDAVKDTLGSNFNGKPNQASAFFYKSIQCLNDDGVIGCVIPSSLLTLDAYKNLRNNIYDLITINLIGKLGNFVFEDALTDVSLIIGHKPKSHFTPTVLWTRNEKGIVQNALRDLRKMTYSNLSTVNEKDYSVFQPVQFPIIKESWKPISLKENELLKTIERFISEQKLSRVEDVFNVQQGIRQGVKDVFKISEDTFKSLPENEKKYFRLVIDNESIKHGSLFNKKFIWYPYDKQGIMLHNEEELDINANTFYTTKLKPSEAILKKRKGISEWWGLTRPRNWQFEKKPKLVSTEFGKSDSFAFDVNGSFVVERGNAWIPKNNFENSDYYFYLALFSSTFFDKLLSIYSKQLAGGNWYDLGKMYTSQIPIPSVNSEDVKNSDGYSKLVEIGKELSIGNSYIKSVSDEILIKYFYPEV
ncbi:HsdM family class I SAM-dependent methyltransferase [Flavobacterium sp. LS1P3]|uniref:HsdM family class I SAM-dependent methyltransferase n=1 Tax=Flavobacterium sp. LS1P3 TaxID=3401720 RepID=UPI003AAE9238